MQNYLRLVLTLPLVRTQNWSFTLRILERVKGIEPSS
jgi:hypothetical protein